MTDGGIVLSRKQWGHGYYKGYADGEKGAKTEKYICAMDEDNLICTAFMILEKKQDIYVLQSLSDVLLFMCATGRKYEFDENEDFPYAYITEKSLEQLSPYNKPVFFYSQKAFLQFVLDDLRKRTVF